ncbi:GIY-YIG nuclease family protein [Vulcanisaeta distributa]|uniref:GIY-YIG nuclease family protein n=1 Tax=Vulcanisaeta distributa TaxID=164451 RepID=UPI000B1D4210|nr:GIY-YIG nuclease family protein [Vulcanisaeta distributa]
MVQVGDIERVIRGCLNIIGVSAGDCVFGIYNCGSIDVHGGAGAYVFFDDSGGVYYVGEANDVARRLLKEHCSVHIGGSEGVVKFLMHYLEEICANSGKWVGLDAWVERNSLRRFWVRRLIV